MTVNVTARDIREGKRGSAGGCPIARAVRRYAGGQIVQVTPLTIRLGTEVSCLPMKVTRFIGRFDAGKRVRPFTFTVFKFLSVP